MNNLKLNKSLCADVEQVCKYLNISSSEFVNKLISEALCNYRGENGFIYKKGFDLKTKKDVYLIRNCKFFNQDYCTVIEDGQIHSIPRKDLVFEKKNKQEKENKNEKEKN